MPETSTPLIDTLTCHQLVPGTGLETAKSGWSVTAPHVRFTTESPLQPGWYEVRIGATSAERFTIRKRLEITFDSADTNPRPVGREAFAWNQSFHETFMLKLTRPTAGVRLDIWHAEGTLKLDTFGVRPISGTAIVARAFREKVRLTRAYRCFGPALWRGGRMLLKGKFSEFGAKLIRGLTDSRGMQLGTVEVGEVNGAWWRRHALPAEEADKIRHAVDAMSAPPPIAVLLPIDNYKLDPARLSAHSVRRQLYPHWQLLIAASGSSDLMHHLERLVGTDPRVTIIRVPKWSGRASAIARAVSGTDCERLIVLPPGMELAEHALFHVAEELKRNPEADLIGCRVASGFSTGLPTEIDADAPRVWLTKTRNLSDAVPTELSAKSLGQWAVGNVPSEQHTVLDPILIYPIDDRPLLDRSRVGKAPIIPGKTLYLAADVRGIGGYDHVTFALLKGLPSAGAELRMHPIAVVRSDLVPPSLLPPIMPRRVGAPMLAVGPPFLVPRFGLDEATAAYTMWETDRLDPKWVPQLNKAGLIIVPSQWQADCFRADGITTKLAVAPLGFDPLVYHPSGKFPNVCTFGTAGALTAGGLRKNAQWVIDLFRRAFPTEADVKIRIKISPGSPSVETYDDPRIDVIRAVLPHGELADWYRSLTAYVNGSFGEGFGLHLIEAMACGRPLVTPCHSGLTAFFDPGIGYAVDYKLVSVRNDIYTGQWAEPNEDAMIAQMRAVYANRTEAERLGARAAARAKNFTWKAAGQQLVNALRGHGLLSNTPKAHE